MEFPLAILWLKPSWFTLTSRVNEPMIWLVACKRLWMLSVPLLLARERHSCSASFETFDCNVTVVMVDLCYFYWSNCLVVPVVVFDFPLCSSCGRPLRAFFGLGVR